MKLSDLNVEATEWAALRAIARDDPRIRTITEFLDDAGMWSLIASCDAVLSTHRAEGFGMVPAQAMLLGRAVVATGWSGNLDYMTAETSELLPYRLIPAEDADRRYDIPGAMWADADISAAVRSLRRLYEDPEHRGALAAAGRHSITRYLAAERERLIKNIKSWGMPNLE
jgi:glycosyltransferase involved in cell wall biosynthesis